MAKLASFLAFLTVVSTARLAVLHYYSTPSAPLSHQLGTSGDSRKLSKVSFSAATTASSCEEDSSGEWTVTKLTREDGYPTYDEDLSQFLEGPAFDKDPKELKHAACEIRIAYYWTHFPHTMQQLYRCWSYWLAHDKLPPVLIWRRHRKTRLNAFLSGFVGMLEKTIQLKVVWRHEEEYSDYRETYVQAKNSTKWTGYDIEITDFALVDPKRQLNRILESQIPTLNAAGCSLKNQLPRIAILNRDQKSGRHLLNAAEMALTIHAAVPSLPEIRIDTFEEKSFLEQAQFMAETDIVLTPHGAHLTALPFLPRCASVLEFFPKDYLCADYFGSLAKATGVQHSFLYLDGGGDEHATRMIPHEKRYHFVQSHEYKMQSQCPPQSKVVAAVQQMVQSWLECRTET